MAPVTAVSAPGKVLLAGGYLVLDREYTGLVFGLNARIHVAVQPVPTGSGVSLSEIVVRSPQFRNANWEFGYRLVEKDGGIQVTQLRASASSNLHPNPFVETALSYALTYISTLKSPNIEPATITILADDDYYSQPAEIQRPAASTSSGFTRFNVYLWEAHKTGLGSSAALVTAFTAAVLLHYLPPEAFSLSDDDGRSRLHNLAQAAHCAAQGKVGSGFDVASAVFGSCLYRRFSPALVDLGDGPGTPGFAGKLKALVEQTTDDTKWDTQITKSAVDIPQGIRLVMCDVDCGSQTPGMVKNVLTWRRARPEEANPLWNRLHSGNEKLAAELVRLAKRTENDYSTLRQCIHDVRTLIREISRLSGVPIEPEPQTRLLDACSDLPGVIGGVVPGAGGYDAIVLLIEDRPDVEKGLRRFLDDWKVLVEEADNESLGKVRLLGVCEEMEGVREEDAGAYKEWLG